MTTSSPAVSTVAKVGSRVIRAPVNRAAKAGSNPAKAASRVDSTVRRKAAGSPIRSHAGRLLRRPASSESGLTMLILEGCL